MLRIALSKLLAALLFSCLLTSLVHAQVSSGAIQIYSLYQKIQAENRYVGSFKESDLASLPVGIAKEVNGKQYVIAIDSARFTTQGAFFNVYAQLTLPGTDETLAFAARNVSFNPGGISVSSGARLELVSEHSIKISEKVKLILPTSGNYLEWDLAGKTSALTFALISATIYLLNHIYRLDDGLETLLYIFFLGVLFVIPVLLTKRLWFTGGMHWIGNTTFFYTHTIMNVEDGAGHFSPNTIFCFCILLFIPVVVMIIRFYRRALIYKDYVGGTY